ncbi:restriction endonuclease [Helicobacter suis]|uniref:restriction endonuclease n=1 Tax=Helicobacter suis TaxID=104628 RepID=UPI001F08830B|nr:restriction endonuclease [Helicobacter suis]
MTEAELEQKIAEANEKIGKARQELLAQRNALEEEKKVISKKEQKLHEETQKFQDFKEYSQNEERYKAERKTSIELELRQYSSERKKEIEQELQKELEQQSIKGMQDFKTQCNQILQNFNENTNKAMQELKAKGDELAEHLKKESELNLREQQVQAKEQALDNFETKIKDEAREEVREEIELYQRQIEEQKKCNERLRDEVGEIYTLKDALYRCQQEERYKQLESLEKENERLGQDLKKQQEEHNDLKLAYENLTKEENKTIMNLQAENKRLRDRAGELESTEGELRHLKEDKERLKREVDILNQEILARDEKIQNLLSQYESTAKQTEGRINSVLDQIQRHAHPDLNHERLELTNEIEYLTHIQTGIANLGIIYPTRLLYAFHTALKSATYSPLSVLLGVSGTGKSELPKLYAYFGGFNFLAQPVQPTWDSPESMMGYFNMVEDKFDSTEILRFFVQTTYSSSFITNNTEDKDFGLQEGMNLILLDEMNLAHIEQYFAEFLSKLEQKRTGIGVVNIGIKLGTGIFWERPLGDNLLWVGTMNEDESTKALSDKVLDRAFCLNFPRPKKLQGLKLQQENQENPYTFKYLPKEIWEKWQKERFLGDLERYNKLASQINKELTKTGRAIGHRVWQGIEFYMRSHPLVLHYQNEDKKRDLALKFAFEEQVVQKIVPKLRGLEMEDTGKTTLDAIKVLLEQEKLDLKTDFENAIKNDYRQFIWNSADYLSNSEWETLLPKNVD